jgi:hypothetical protein
MCRRLLFSQLLTLYTTPVIYVTFDRLARRFSERRAKSQTQTTHFRPSQRNHEFSELFIRNACRHYVADNSVSPRRSDRVRITPGVPASTNGLSRHSGRRVTARSQSENHGVIRSDST